MGVAVPAIRVRLRVGPDCHAARVRLRQRAGDGRRVEASGPRQVSGQWPDGEHSSAVGVLAESCANADREKRERRRHDVRDELLILNQVGVIGRNCPRRATRMISTSTVSSATRDHADTGAEGNVKPGHQDEWDETRIGAGPVDRPACAAGISFR